MAVMTHGLRNLQAQLDAAFPDRHRPDGWIGDRSHRGRTSGHNADDTPGSKPSWDHDPDNLAEVRALDVGADLGASVDSRDLVTHLTQLPGLATVVRYIIHKGRIYHARDNFRSRPHDGPPHDEHIHIEAAWTQAADNNTTFDYRLQEVPVALTPDDKRWIEQLFARGQQPNDGGITSKIGRDALDQGVPNPIRGHKTTVWMLLEDMARALQTLLAQSEPPVEGK